LFLRQAGREGASPGRGWANFASLDVELCARRLRGVRFRKRKTHFQFVGGGN
jgi:hypothetical protein